VLLADRQQGSLAVKVGDPVEAGDLLARCGNSGNTSAPHLHMQVQTHLDLWAAENRTLPIHFRASGDEELGRPARRNDVIGPRAASKGGE